ncbi:hypothetical protein QBC33DRAFT_421216, partial [Phialemonium atrogriseum]
PMAPLTIPSLLPSTDFYLASGTVTVDRLLRKVLIIRERGTSAYQLPRGRKDWSEALEATAARETFEETGVRCALLPVPLSTRATPPSGRQHAQPPPGSGGDVRLTEPFALMQHQQPCGALSVVLWFVGEADSAAPAAEGTQMADEDYEARWVDYAEAAALMADNGDYAEVVRRALRLVEA